MDQPEDPNQFDQSSHDGGFGNDIKNEFTGNYNTGTNPVSNIFNSGFLAETKNRVLLGILAVVIIAVGSMTLLESDSYDEEEEDYLTSEDMDDELFSDEYGDEEEESNDEEIATESNIADSSAPIVESSSPNELTSASKTMVETDSVQTDSLPMTMEDGSMASDDDMENAEDDPKPAAEMTPASAPIAQLPQVGFQKRYDETSYPAEFRWEGSGGWISFARSPDMKPVLHKFRSKQNVFRYRKLLPGVWYWQVSNRAGKSETRSFEILPPTPRKITLTTPSNGENIVGTGGTVAWSGDTRVAYYRVEIGNGDWARVPYRFATSGTQVKVNDVPPGSYQMRVGAFSEVSGRWEYTEPVTVSVQ